jgi:hypothetical protein
VAGDTCSGFLVFTNTQALNGNDLRTAPSWLSGVYNLTSLCLNRCALTQIPAAFVNHRHLTTLDVSGNLFSSTSIKDTEHYLQYLVDLRQLYMSAVPLFSVSAGAITVDMVLDLLTTHCVPLQRSLTEVDPVADANRDQAERVGRVLCTRNHISKYSCNS